jgi:hypothetical protein
MEDLVALEANLGTEVAWVIVDLLEIILGSVVLPPTREPQVGFDANALGVWGGGMRSAGFHAVLAKDHGKNETMGMTFSLLLKLLQLGPSDRLLRSLFSLLRRFIVAYKGCLFHPTVDYCRALSVQVNAAGQHIRVRRRLTLAGDDVGAALLQLQAPAAEQGGHRPSLYPPEGGYCVHGPQLDGRHRRAGGLQL